MRIGGFNIGGGENKQKLMGLFKDIPIYDSTQSDQEEACYMTPEKFKILGQIVEGFIKMGREHIPSLDDEVNQILLSKETKVEFLHIDRMGFYHYQINHGKKEIHFAIEPHLHPVYNFIVHDMTRRHRAQQHESFVSHDRDKIVSPLTSMDQACKPWQTR
jgi:hypothetical protein